MMNSPVSYCGIDPIRAQLNEQAVKGSYLALERKFELTQKQWEEDMKNLEKVYGPFPIIFTNPSEFNSEEERFDFN